MPMVPLLNLDLSTKLAPMRAPKMAMAVMVVEIQISIMKQTQATR
jgi:hypothetical protein